MMIAIAKTIGRPTSLAERRMRCMPVTGLADDGAPSVRVRLAGPRLAVAA